ncbi:MAG: RND transporter, partial [Betaproteobacteria bacterium]|nr:RND transporter [Betaproteobacteria bacterium]
MQKTFAESVIRFSLDKPRTIIWAVLVSTLILTTMAALPSLWPQQFPALQSLKIDTDPENMLSESEPARVFHNQAKKEFSLYDIVVVGIVNEEHANGVFNTASLTRIFKLTEFARQLNWPDPQYPDQWKGVIEVDMIAPSMVDNIEQGGLGAVNFSWLMPQPPTSEEEAIAVRDRAARIPFLHDTLVSRDGKAMALYLPLTSKHISYEVRKALLAYVADWKGTGDQVYITGLP